MTNREILDNLPIGEVVPKRVLASMRCKGLIWDYSYWGYLESVKICYNDKDDSWHTWRELFPKGNAQDAENFIGTSDEARERFGSNLGIEYQGFTFGPKYFDGCFSPYLVKTGIAK